MKTKKLSRIPATKISPYLPATANHMFDKLLSKVDICDSVQKFPDFVQKITQTCVNNKIKPSIAPKLMELRLGEKLKLAYQTFSKQCFGKINFSKVVLFLAEFMKACKKDVERIKSILKWFYEKSVPVIKKSVGFFEKARHAILGQKKSVKCNKVSALPRAPPSDDEESEENGQEVRTNLNKHCLKSNFYFRTLSGTDHKFSFQYETNQSAKGINPDHPTISQQESGNNLGKT
uniref:Uncharacterized protein n=1 Tax=Panagrolaimus sp. PS1159 TaxID=55785 RepID=A0AC35G0K5_9BILA